MPPARPCAGAHGSIRRMVGFSVGNTRSRCPIATSRRRSPSCGMNTSRAQCFRAVDAEAHRRLVLRQGPRKERPSRGARRRPGDVHVRGFQALLGVDDDRHQGTPVRWIAGARKGLSLRAAHCYASLAVVTVADVSTFVFNSFEELKRLALRRSRRFIGHILP